MKAAAEKGVSTEHMPVACKPSKQVCYPIEAKTFCSLPCSDSAESSSDIFYVTDDY